MYVCQDGFEDLYNRGRDKRRNSRRKNTDNVACYKVASKKKMHSNKLPLVENESHVVMQRNKRKKRVIGTKSL